MLQIPSQHSITTPFLSIPSRNLVYIGDEVYYKDEITIKILAIDGNRGAYIHGSNSSSLQLFTAQENPGFLLPRNILLERNINCHSGECTQPQFKNAYGENGHSKIFAYKVTHFGDSFFIDQVAQYANYNTSANGFFPVIYILDINSEFLKYPYGEYVSEKTSIPPENIRGIMVPYNKLSEVNDIVSSNFPHIKIISLD